MLQLRQQAYMMYVEQGMTAAYIAKTLRVNKNTLTRWCKLGGWKYYRSVKIAAPAKLVGMCYDICKDIAEKMSGEGGIYLPIETANLNHMAGVIKKLEKHNEDAAGLKGIMDFNLYLKQVSPELLNTLVPYQQEYMRTRLGVDQRLKASKFIKPKQPLMLNTAPANLPGAGLNVNRPPVKNPHLYALRPT